MFFGGLIISLGLGFGSIDTIELTLLTEDEKPFLFLILGTILASFIGVCYLEIMETVYRKRVFTRELED